MMMNRYTTLITALLLVLAVSELDPYSRNLAESRKIAEAMSLEQLVGQMIAADFGAITDIDKEITNPDEAVKLYLGSLLLTGIMIPT